MLGAGRLYAMWECVFWGKGGRGAGCSCIDFVVWVRVWAWGGLMGVVWGAVARGCLLAGWMDGELCVPALGGGAIH